MYFSKKKAASAGKTILGLKDIDWAGGNEVYENAAKEAIELNTAAFHQQLDREYKFFIKKKEEAYELMNPESGSFEGNWSDEFPQQPYPPLPDAARIRRAVGQKAFIEQFIVKETLAHTMPKVLPELVELIGGFNVTRNSDGLVSGLQFCKDHFSTPERMGMYRLLTLNSKSDIIEKQYKDEGRYYSALVPVIMYAIRKAQGIKYSEWALDEIQYVMHSKLSDAMLWQGTVPPADKLLEDRDIGLRYASGVKVGKLRDPVTTYRLYSTNGTVYEGIPELAAVMLSQIWCAHPNNRIKYMVLDPIDWDNVPMPLISTDVTPVKQTINSTTILTDSPWL